MSIRTLSNYSFRNSDLIKQSTICGCYHCCDVFDSKDIVEFTDGGKTCLCPKCKVDAVLGDKHEFQLNKEFLEAAKKYWF